MSEYVASDKLADSQRRVGGAAQHERVCAL